MMENERQLIDKEPIKKFIEDGLNNPNRMEAFGHDAIEILAEIEYAPTVDAVEVVRCKDCKWYRIAPIDNVPYCCHESGYCGEYMGGLFYCACGERRTDG